MKTNNHRTKTLTIATLLLPIILGIQTIRSMEPHPRVVRPAPAVPCLFRPIVSNTSLPPNYFMPDPEYAAHAICNAFYFLVDSFERQSEKLATSTVKAMQEILRSAPTETTADQESGDDTDSYSKIACILLKNLCATIKNMFEIHCTSAQIALDALRLAIQTKKTNIAHHVMALLSQRHENLLAQDEQFEDTMIRHFASLDGNDRPASLASLAVSSQHLPIFESFEIKLKIKNVDGTLGNVAEMDWPPDLQSALRQSWETYAHATFDLVACTTIIANLSAFCHQYGAKREVACGALATLLNDAKNMAYTDNALFLFQLRSLMRPPSPCEPTPAFTPAKQQISRTKKVAGNIFSPTSAFQKAQK